MGLFVGKNSKILHSMQFFVQKLLKKEASYAEVDYLCKDNECERNGKNITNDSHHEADLYLS